MTAPVFVFASVTAVGGVVGAVNAVASDNAHFLPSTVFVAPGKRIVRPGLIMNVLVGAVACFAVFLVLDCALCDNRAEVSSRRVLAVMLAAVLIAALASRVLTSAVDNRLLRASVVKACSAPAAHPDTVRAVALASPYTVYLTTDRLAPPRRGSSSS